MNAKKLLSVALGSSLIAGSLTLPIFAQEENIDLESFFEDLNADSVFGFSDSSSISVDEVSSSSATISFKTIKDPSDSEPVFTYKLMYSSNADGVLTAGIDEIEEMTYNLLEQGNSSIEYDAIEGKGSITVSGLSPNTAYTYVLTPINKSDVAGEKSKEMSFSTNSASSFDEGDDLQGAAGVVLNNVTHQQNGNEVTVMWDPIEGGYEVQLSMAAVTELQGTSIGSSPASNGQYGPIAMDSIGLYNLDLVLFDSEGNKAGPTKRYVVKIESLSETVEASPSQPAQAGTTTTTTTSSPSQPGSPAAKGSPAAPGKTVVSTPQVGPTQNIIFAFLILSVLFYVMLRYRKTK